MIFAPFLFFKNNVFMVFSLIYILISSHFLFNFDLRAIFKLWFFLVIHLNLKLIYLYIYIYIYILSFAWMNFIF
jgi:hypothetical protein